MQYFHTLAGVGRAAGIRDNSRGAVQRAFRDILSPAGQVSAAASPTQAGITTLASAFLGRGPLPLDDYLNCVSTAQKELTFPPWNQDACKVGRVWSRNESVVQ